MHDYVERTSQTGKGQTFIGRCRLCGKEGLTLKTMRTDECPASGKYNADEVVLAAIEDRDPEPPK